MTTLTVTAKGQITLRRDLLQHLGVQPGSRISVHKLPNGRIAVEAEQPRGRIADVFGMLRSEGQATVTIDEMNDVITRGWAGER